MDLSDDQQAFLRDLVKASRQRSQHVTWTDRDGTKRLTALNPADAARLAQLARQLKLSPGETLRQAAHIPVSRGP